MKYLIFLPLALLLANALQAQTARGLIRGSLADAQQLPVANATLLLKQARDTNVLYKGELSNAQGSFVFEDLAEGSYHLDVQVVGFERLTRRDITIGPSDTLVDLGLLLLKPLAKTLDRVVVRTERPFIERLADRTVVNVENSVVQAGSSVMEMMEKLPGVTVGADGSVSLKGRQGLIIAIDGKPTMLSASELASLFRGMPSSDIQKVEIITNPSARYDASGNAGVINIVMKKSQRQGINGTANTSYRQGRYARNSVGLNLNIRDKWYNIFLSYTYSLRNTFILLDMDRRFSRQQVLDTTLLTRTFTKSRYNTNLPRLGADFTLSKKTTLSLSGSGMISLLRTPTDSYTEILEGGKRRVGSYQFYNYLRDELDLYSGNLQLSHQFDSAGRSLSVEAQYSNFGNASDQDIFTRLRNASETLMDQFSLIGDADTKVRIHVGKADYVQPLKGGASLEVGIKSSYVRNDNDNKFFQALPAGLRFDSARSNHFLYSEAINAAYANWKKESERMSFQLGLRAEHTDARGEQLLTGANFDRNYLQLFPSGSVEYRVNDRHSFSLNAGRRIDRPAYRQLNPFRQFWDATAFGQGNPELMPQLTYNSELTWSYKSSFFGTLGYSLTNNVIADVLLRQGQSNITVVMPVNLDRLNYYSLNLVYSKKIGRHWSTNTNLLGFYGKYSGSAAGAGINEGIPSFQFNSTNSFQLGKGLNMEAGIWYAHRNRQGYDLNRSLFNLSFGIQKKLLAGRGTLGFNVNDLTRTAYPRGITTLGSVEEVWSTLTDTRSATLTFSYRFGRGEVKRTRQNTAAEDELRRTGN